MGVPFCLGCFYRIFFISLSVVCFFSGLGAGPLVKNLTQGVAQGFMRGFTKDFIEDFTMD